MKKEWLLLLASIAFTLLVAIGLLRWLAPGLLGGPTDLQLVQLDEKLPAYYKGIFREENFNNENFQLKDPLTRVRNNPLMPRFTYGLGPHDVLGFRNADVPVAADVITIGDSVTYGNNAIMEQNWPAYLESAIGRDETNVYNMSTGGWGAVQYLDMFINATIFRPRVVVVAFYTGNDSLESFSMVYGNEHWRGLIPDAALTASDAPSVMFPAPLSEQWGVNFRDGVSTVFTPTLRLAANQDHVAVMAGYAIMADIAMRISEMARQSGIVPVFTIIPTKELAFSEKVSQEGLDVPADYTALVDLERRHIEHLAEVIQSLPGAVYIDTVTPLQVAAAGPANLYNDTADGHPTAPGYRVIGETIAEGIAGSLPASKRGLYAMQADDTYQIVLVNDEGVWNFNSDAMIEANGWPPGEIASVEMRDIVNLPHQGVITTVDQTKFGPACCTSH